MLPIKCALIILFQHNLAMLQQTIRSVVSGSRFLSKNLIVIDNSVDKAAANDAYVKLVSKAIVSTKHQLQFSQLQNLMAKTAVKHQFEIYFWAHADVYLMPRTAGGDFGRDALFCIQSRQEPKWGVFFFSYDHRSN